MNTTITEFPLVKRALSDSPHWANEIIQRWDQDRFHQTEPFVKEKYWSDRHSINVFTVVRTNHPDYAGLSWLQFLQKGKRMNQNLSLHTSNRSYYLETEIKRPSMHYMSLDGLHYYIGDDGNHRTCIARFDFFFANGLTMLHGVTVTDFHVYYPLFEIYQEMQRIISHYGIRADVQPYSHPIKREDTSGWMIESYDVKLSFRNWDGKENGARENHLDRISADQKLNELKVRTIRRPSFIKRFFSK